MSRRSAATSEIPARANRPARGPASPVGLRSGRCGPMPQCSSAADSTNVPALIASARCGLPEAPTTTPPRVNPRICAIPSVELMMLTPTG